MSRPEVRSLLFFLAVAACGASLDGAGTGAASSEESAQLQSDASIAELIERADETWQGDFDGMIERRRVRVLMPYTRTSLFLDSKGQARGFEAELFHEYEKFLNSERSRREPRIEVQVIPVEHNQLLPMLAEGRGDIAAGQLTILENRHPGVVFTDPYLTGVSEVVVSHVDADRLSTDADLSGRKVMVVAKTTYSRSLEVLNSRLSAAGRDAVEVVAAEHLETEDVLELVNAGMAPYTVADSYLAELWVSVLPHLRIEPVQLRTGAALGWAVRAESPGLLENLNGFVRRHRKGTLLGNVLFKRYFESSQWLENPLTSFTKGRLGELLPVFRKYGEQYGIDWLTLLAVAYRESRLKPDLVSGAGAVGLMQIRPETAASLGFSNPRDVDENVHAATQYLIQIYKTYLKDDGLTVPNAIDLILASYNAGPTRISRLRREAGAAGLDPNRWFENVEVIAQREIGRETVDYVRSVNKYYFALSQLRAGLVARASEFESLRKPN